MAWYQGDLESAQSSFEESMVIYRELGAEADGPCRSCSKGWGWSPTSAMMNLRRTDSTLKAWLCDVSWAIRGDWLSHSMIWGPGNWLTVTSMRRIHPMWKLSRSLARPAIGGLLRRN